MHKTRRAFPRFLIAMTVAGLVIVGSAAADDEPAIEDPPRKITSKILTRTNEPEIRQGWLQPEFHTRKGRGFEYSRSLAVGAWQVNFRIVIGEPQSAASSTSSGRFRRES